ncbi:hypothetical protein C3B58_10770 [Lactonifactor longoviformis]|uniref:Stage 0 sporulation protein A homolog n=1 Tax=Lactonifactor longoviformis DSM 17459 TaxID=1122155 RepID=A0A1M5CLV9_9CLOT|nr:response regulator [Lactonifactor longoviformis]POP32707.1 hypothetical protein C3B58_10770 [Lactonifactor longoviformis]SHF55656.1 two-component system, response regulator YesN [Lactonifactor longoviformis DSM 17459]
MVKVLVVDDEAYIRRGIIHKVKRLTDFVDEIEEAKNGEEAFHKINSFRPDIVITDIKMPGMNGLLLIEKSLEKNPFIKFIIISGYDDFEYARKAVRLGVFDYLLKPIVNDELKQALVSLKQKIQEERKNARLLGNWAENAEKDMIYKKNRIMESFCRWTGEIPGELLDKVLEYGSIQEDGYITGIQIEVLEQKNQYCLPGENGLYPFVVTNILEECLEKNGRCIGFYEESQNVKAGALVYHTYSIRRLEKELLAVRDKIMEISGLSVCFALGNPQRSLKAFPKSYREAGNALQQKMIYDTKGVITQEDYGLIQKNDYTISENDRRLLSHYLLFIAADQEKLTELGIKMIDDFYEKKVSYRNLKTAYLDLVITVLNEVKNRNNGQYREIYELDVEKIFEQCNSIEGLKKHFRGLIESIAQVTKTEDSDSSKGIIKEIEQRIHTEYFHDLKLSALANEYYINQSYLSTLFLQETGKNFIKYLTEVRLEKARELLETTQFSTSQVAEFVGYNDRSYFTSVFQKKMGVSPAEYRKKVKDEN